MRGLIEHWQNNGGPIGNDTVGESRALVSPTPRARGRDNRAPTDLTWLRSSFFGNSPTVSCNYLTTEGGSQEDTRRRNRFRRLRCRQFALAFARLTHPRS